MKYLHAFLVNIVFKFDFSGAIKICVFTSVQKSTFIDRLKLVADNSKALKEACLLSYYFLLFGNYFPTQKSPVFVGQSGLMNFTLFARGDGCNVKEKRASLQLDDKKVFSAVVEISNNEFILNKVT